mgnify:CR=1 FL=1
MKKALVTGAGGFIGSHLVEALAAQGARVRALPPSVQLSAAKPSKDLRTRCCAA